MPAATDTFNDSKFPVMGILNFSSQIFIKGGNIPLSSLPNTKQQGWVKFNSCKLTFAFISLANTWRPLSRNWSTAFIRLFTLQILIFSNAPADDFKASSFNAPTPLSG